MKALLANRIATVAIALLACGVMGASAETLDELYLRARGEDALVFYAGGPTAPHERRIKDFQQRFPGISVSVTGGFSRPLTSYNIANGYREFMTNAPLVADLRSRFEAYTGPAVNKGGVG